MQVSGYDTYVSGDCQTSRFTGPQQRPALLGRPSTHRQRVWDADLRLCGRGLAWNHFGLARVVYAQQPQRRAQHRIALGNDPLWSSTYPPLLALLRCNAPWMFTNIGDFFTFESTPEEVVGNLLSTHFGDIQNDDTLVDATAVAAVPLKCPSALSNQLQIRHSQAAAPPLGMTRRWAGQPSARAEKELYSRLSAVGAWPDAWKRP